MCVRAAAGMRGVCEKMDSPEAQAKFLGNFRADSIIEDCEAVRFLFSELKKNVYMCIYIYIYIHDLSHVFFFFHLPAHPDPPHLFRDTALLRAAL